MTGPYKESNGCLSAIIFVVIIAALSYVLYQLVR